jgi:hypothetical protein
MSIPIVLCFHLGLDPVVETKNYFKKKRIRTYSKSTDCGTWYPRACRFLSIIHHLHSSYEKGIIERIIHYINDRTEGFDDYFPCTKARCKLQHTTNWLNLFVNMHNKEIEKKIVVK